MTGGHVAVIDIGKTNAKLALVDLKDLSEIAVITRPNVSLPGPPWPHFDVDGHWAFLLDGLARFQREHGINAISVTTHGACAALLGTDGKLVAPILDYEHNGPDAVARDYDALRPPFSETGSPRIGLGLNLGAQLHWQFATDPTLRARIRHVVTYPQYWGHRLTGIAASDVTSLGCHTDLWNPHKAQFSTLVARLGLTGTIAPARPSGDVLGPVLQAVASRTGLAPDIPVYCGIHDSNASLLPHILSRAAPFSVVSTGTWVVAMAIGGHPVRLDPDRDTLINVNALGGAVPSARFMGGREFDLAAGGQCPEPSEDDIAAILADRLMLMPALTPQTGPFRGRQARWTGDEPALGSGRRGAAVGFYLALVTAQCLGLVGHCGPVIVEGPFARNASFRRMLSAATGSPVQIAGGATGTSQGAALLAAGMAAGAPRKPCSYCAPDRPTKGMADYAANWAARLTPTPGQ